MIIKVLLEVSVVLLLTIGFLYEDKFITLEEKMIKRYTQGNEEDEPL